MLVNFREVVNKVIFLDEQGLKEEVLVQKSKEKNGI